MNNEQHKRKQIEEQQKELIKYLTGALPGAVSQFGEIKKASEGILNTLITPSVESQLSADQKKLLDMARGAFDLDGGDIGDKLKDITQTLQNYANSNK